MPCQDLANIYQSYVSDGGQRVVEIEKHLGDGVVGADLSLFYSALRDGDDFAELERLYLQSMQSMVGAEFHECREVLNMLMFLQHVFATALWGYGIEIPGQLEKFVREFDRLDMPSERFRLYLEAQSI